MMKTAWLALGCIMLASCSTNPDGTQSVNKTAVGGAIGAVAGGIIGNRLDKKGSRTGGTIAGAVAGAAAGGGIGYLFDKQEREFEEELAREQAANQIEIERVRDDLLKADAGQRSLLRFRQCGDQARLRAEPYQARQCARQVRSQPSDDRRPHR